jgi:hypothetical protein
METDRMIIFVIAGLLFSAATDPWRLFPIFMTAPHLCCAINIVAPSQSQQRDTMIIDTMFFAKPRNRTLL